MINIANSAELGKLITALSNDIVNAHIHWTLYCDLHEAIQAQPVVWSQSNTFWYLTLEAHVTTAILHLCRAFDQEQKSLHLLSWLKTIKANLQCFDIDDFKKRLSGNAFVDSLAETYRKPDPITLDNDITLCDVSDPLVKKLVTHRNNSVAHRSATLAVNSKPLRPDLLLSDDELNALLARALHILNQYSHFFSATTYSVNMIGRHDYRFIFSSVAAAVEE
jgi:AbiU2